jgi:hypothetical protein
MAFVEDFSGFTPPADLQTSADWTPFQTYAQNFVVQTDGSFNHLEAGAFPGAGGISCPDQGSADQYLIVHQYGLSPTNAYYFVRGTSRFKNVSYALRGAGGAGSRLVKKNTSETNLLTRQGVSNEWIKVEAEGTTYRWYAGGTGASPSWVQIGSDQTVSDAEVPISATTQGMSLEGASPNANLIQYFEAGALGGGGVTSDGVLTAQSATMAGTGTVTPAAGTVTSNGVLEAQLAAIVGDAFREITSSGTPASQSATAAGAGAREITSSGALESDPATAAGSGEPVTVFTSNGVLLSQSAAIVGAGSRVVTSVGVLESQAASTTGESERVITSSGAMESGPAQIIGFGPNVDISTGMVGFGLAIAIGIGIDDQ